MSQSKDPKINHWAGTLLLLGMIYGWDNAAILILNEEIIISIIFALFCYTVWKYLHTDDSQGAVFSEKIDYIKTAYSKIYMDRWAKAQKNIDGCISVVQVAKTKSPSFFLGGEGNRTTGKKKLHPILNLKSIVEKDQKLLLNSDQFYSHLKTYPEHTHNGIKKIIKNFPNLLYKYLYI